jgi:putative holliday junction resolvase
MKYLGLDLGSRTCGVAISDPLGMLARTYTTIRFRDDDYNYAANEVKKICEKEGVTEIVLGLPKHMNGDQGIRAQISYDFKALLESDGKLHVTLLDERLTTVVVDRAMIEGNLSREKRHQKKDELAAVVILEDYLNRK